MPGTTRRSTAPSSSTGTAAPKDADLPPALPERATAPGTGPQPAPPSGPKPSVPMGLTLRMPFLTVTIGPQPVVPPAPGAGNAGNSLEKLAFYGGVAAMGALGVIEWPVAAAVAAGTWVAQHTLPGRRRPPPPPQNQDQRATPAGGSPR